MIVALLAVASTTPEVATASPKAVVQGRRLVDKSSVCSAEDTLGYHSGYVSGYGAALLECLCTNTDMFDDGPPADEQNLFQTTYACGACNAAAEAKFPGISANCPGFSYDKSNVCSADDTSGYHAVYVSEATGYGAALLDCLCDSTSMYDNGPYTSEAEESSHFTTHACGACYALTEAKYPYSCLAAATANKANVCSADDTSGYHAAYVSEATGYGAALLDCLCDSTSMYDNGPYTSEAEENSDFGSTHACGACGALAEAKYPGISSTCPPLPPPPPADEGDGGGGEPCFARSTTACRVLDPAASPDAAFAACYGEAGGSAAERVPMTQLAAGDYVLSGAGMASRVVANQHRLEGAASAVLRIEHSGGELSLTPDHVLFVDGAFVPAREVAAGSMLGEYEVTAVTRGVAGVINPITVAGTILAAGTQGEPVLASVYPEWVAERMLKSAVPLPLSLGNLLSCLFPATAQAFYDGLVEPLFPAAGGYRSYLEAVMKAVPPALSPLAFVAGDLAVASAFALFALASPTLLLVAGLAAARSRK